MTETAEEMVGSVDKIVDDPELSAEIVKQLLKDFGGMQIYLPLPNTAFKKEIDAEIYDALDGTQETVRRLCREYGITSNTLYVIHRREKDRRAREREKRLSKDLDLFQS